MKERVCKDCKAEGRVGKPLDAPYTGPRCLRHHRAYRRSESERAAERRRVQTFGLAPGDYERLLKAQGGRCTCGRKPGKRRLAVDHDHTCCPGKTSCGECVRQLLCWTCNKFLEHIKDQPEVLEKMAENLRNPPARKVPMQLSLLHVPSNHILSL